MSKLCCTLAMLMLLCFPYAPAGQESKAGTEEDAKKNVTLSAEAFEKDAELKKKLFKLIDENGDGTISKDELRRVFLLLSTIDGTILDPSPNEVVDVTSMSGSWQFRVTVQLPNNIPMGTVYAYSASTYISAGDIPPGDGLHGSPLNMTAGNTRFGNVPAAATGRTLPELQANPNILVVFEEKRVGMGAPTYKRQQFTMYAHRPM